MRIIRSDSGRHETIEHDVLSGETGKLSYVSRTTREVTDDEVEDQEEWSPPVVQVERPL